MSGRKRNFNVCLIGHLPKLGGTNTIWDEGGSAEHLAGVLTVVLNLKFPRVVNLD